MGNAFDTYLYHLINQKLTAEWLDIVMVKFSDKFFWIPFYALVIFLLARTYRKRAVLIVLYLALSILLSDRCTSGFMKPCIGRVRPCHEAYLTPRHVEGVACSDTGSMASSHAANHFAMAVFMVCLLRHLGKKYTIFWLSWAFAVAYSRVYLGVHYPTDVIVGALIGSAFGLLSFYLYRKSVLKLQWE